MPFAQVKELSADLARATKMAKEGNANFLAGEVLSGKTITLRGELADANCYLGSHTHAYDHAFCAKLCAANGSALLFLSDEGSQVYIVLSEKNGVRLPAKILDRIGVPGTVVQGKTFVADGLHVLTMGES